MVFTMFTVDGLVGREVRVGRRLVGREVKVGSEVVVKDLFEGLELRELE